MTQKSAAAKRGLGLMASGTNRILSGLTRRFTTLAETDVLKKKKDAKLFSRAEQVTKDKTLYMCFSELHCYENACYTNQVVRPIRLDDDDKYDDNEEEFLDKAAYLRRFKYNKSHCTTFGSNIVFPYGPDSRNVCSVDTSTDSIEFSQARALSSRKLDKKIVSNEPHHKLVRLGDIDGKLYRFDNNRRKYSCHPYYSYFEVFDMADGAEWRPLVSPPFRSSPEYNVAFLESSKKILGWELEVPGVFCFDTTNPESGWTAVPPALGDTLPFLNHTFATPFYGCRDLRNRPPGSSIDPILELELPSRFYNTPLFIHSHHREVGDFHLYFHYDSKEPHSVSPYFLSNNFDSFQAIDEPIRLPASCADYFPIYDQDECFKFVNSDYEFVHLGAQKVGLVINKYFGDKLCGYKGKLLLITFEYDIHVKESKPTIEIRTQMLGIRRFAYHGRPVQTHPYTPPYSHINGAFCL